MALLSFILGIIIGSFLNVCIYRIPRGESVVFPASHCTSCGVPLKWYNLIPLLSYIFQRGKCSYCGEKISLQYPIIELLDGFVYLYMYSHFGFNIDFIFYSIVFSILIVISIIDFMYQIIPDSLNIIILIIAIIYKIFKYRLYGVSPNIVNSILGILLSSGLFLLIAVISKGGMGGGDIKLIGVLGFVLGLRMVCLNILLSFILAGIISIVLLAFKIVGIKDPIPFGPFICFSFMITAIWGDKIINWYLSLF